MRTVAFYSVDGVSKAKTPKAILVQRDDGKEAWIPMSQASVRFTGPNYKVRVSVPDWFYGKIVWKNPTAYEKQAVAPVSKPAGNPYIGMDYGNMMEESMVLSEMLGQLQSENAPLSEIKKIQGTLILIADAMRDALK